MKTSCTTRKNSNSGGGAFLTEAYVYEEEIKETTQTNKVKPVTPPKSPMRN